MAEADISAMIAVAQDDTSWKAEADAAWTEMLAVARRTKKAYKSSDQTLTVSSTTLQDVTSLSFAVTANEVYFVEAFLRINAANATMDAKVGWTYPSGTTMQWAALNSGSTTFAAFAPQATSTTNIAMLAESATLLTGTGAGVNIGFTFGGWVIVSSTAGTVQLQMAQNTSDAGNLIVKAHSFLRLTKLA